MVEVLTAIAIVPSAPVLVPQLAGAASCELTEVHAGLAAAVGGLPERWVAIGVAETAMRIGPDAAGSFAGYGVDLEVALSPGRHPLRPMPLCALITAWLRSTFRSRAHAEVRCFAAGEDAEVALRQGRALRAEIDEAADPVGALVVADGWHTLTPSAPGGYDPDSPARQQELDDALATGDAAALTRLPDAVVGRVAFAVLAGMAEPAPAAAEEFYRGAPYGVGYFAGLWSPRAPRTGP